jgi:predicted phosphohydrolase
MKLRIVSDLHVECGNYEVFKDVGEDVVVAAGDIHKATHAPMMLRDTFPNKEIVYVAGNHEFYGFDYDVALATLRKECKEVGIHFLENDTVTLQGQRFLGTTLWAGPLLHPVTRNYINDFNVITRNGRLFTLNDCTNLNAVAREFLEQRTEEDVVVTHFMPHYKYTAPRWVGNLMNQYFANDIDPEGVKLWVFGHTHDTIYKNNVVCNPHGYSYENPHFNPDLVVEI